MCKYDTSWLGETSATGEPLLAGTEEDTAAAGPKYFCQEGVPVGEPESGGLSKVGKKEDLHKGQSYA